MSSIEAFLRADDQHRIARALAQTKAFDPDRYLAQILPHVDQLALKARLAVSAKAIVDQQNGPYQIFADRLDEAAPHVTGFPGMAFPEAIALAGLADTDRSLQSLRWMTRFSSSEFAVRPFLERAFSATLSFLEQCAGDDNEHVRRWASEGCRPRLPWAPNVTHLSAQPLAAAPILSQLKADPSKYVRTSVANHLNDISKLDPDGLMRLIAGWPSDSGETRWIIQHGLRTLIKSGHRAALEHLGFRPDTPVTISHFTVSPEQLELGQSLQIKAVLERHEPCDPIVVDYVIDYASQSGRARRKTFKGRVITGSDQQVTFAKSQKIRDFSTRTHVAGRHGVTLLVNGRPAAKGHFDLVIPEQSAKPSASDGS